MVRVGVNLLPALLTLIIFLSASHLVFAQVLNEIMPHPSSGSDWIEIYNPTANSLNLSGWTLSDSTSTIKTLTDSIPASGFSSVDVSNRLNNSGDRIYLKNPAGETIDSYSYSGDPGVDRSFGRSPDGGSWAILSSSSKDGSNGNSIVQPSTQPTSTPDPTPSPNNPAPTSSTKSSFTVSNIPSQIDVSQSFSVTVDLTLPNSPNSTFYLKGAFKKADSSNYFGLTKVGSSWIKNGASYSNQFQITTNSAGHWSGSLEVQADSADSGFKGSGDYTFKVGRYSASGSGPTWSNEVTIKVTGQQGGEEKTQASPHSTSSPKASSAVKGTSIKTVVQNPSSSTYYHPVGSSSASASIEPSPTPEVEIKGEKKANIFPIIGGILILVGLIFIIFIYLKNRSTTNI